MKIKEVLQRKIEKDFEIHIDTDSIATLQRMILHEEKTEKRPKVHAWFTQLQTIKPFIFPTVGLFALLLIVFTAFKYGPAANLNKYSIAKPVSAQEILENMQTSINSERLHFTKEAIGTGPVYENSPTQITQTWLDRKAKTVRVDSRDNSETVNSIIIKGAPPRSTMYRFVPVGETLVEKEGKKIGTFITQANRDGYELYIDELLKKDYIDIQKRQGLTVDPVYESITYQGHEAYKITLNYTKHKPIQNEWTALLTIDKMTHLPYERLDIQREPEQFGGEVSQMKTTYTFSTDFSDDVFALNAPAGWAVMEDPKIVNFDLGTIEGYQDGQAQTPENAWLIPRIVNVIISNDKYPKEKEDGSQSIIMPRGGMLPIDYKFRLFIVKKVFSPSDVPINNRGLAYEEITPTELHSEQNYSPIKAYSLPEIPGNTYNPRSIVMLKLEITDSKGKRYKVEKGFTIQELTKVEYIF